MQSIKSLTSVASPAREFVLRKILSPPVEPSANSGYWIAFGVVCCALCLPLVVLRYPPLVDYPSHLARVYLSAHYWSVPAYQRDYTYTHEIIPNLAIDLIFWVLLQFVGLITASRIFLVSLVLLFATGCHLLGKAIAGRPTRAAILCAFLIYDSMLLYGFVNYLFGIGMFCVTLACWWNWRQRWTLVRMLVLAALIFITYLAHLTAFAFLAVSVAVAGGLDWYRGRQRSAAFFPAFTLMVPEIVLFFIFRHRAAAPGMYWGSVRQKIIGLGSLVLTYDYHFDAAWIVAVGVLGVLAWTKVKAARAAWPTLAAGLAFLALFVVSPLEWLGGSPVDARFIPPAAILIALSLQLRMSRRAKDIFFVLLLLVLSVRVVAIWRTWRVLDHRISQQVEMFKMLPPGASLYPVVMPTGLYPVSKMDRCFEHVAELASVERYAFVPSRLAYPGQEILLYRAPRNYLAPNVESLAWLAALRSYSYAWSYAVPGNVEQALEANADRIAQAGKGSLWRLRR